MDAPERPIRHPLSAIRFFLTSKYQPADPELPVLLSVISVISVVIPFANKKFTAEIAELLQKS